MRSSFDGVVPADDRSAAQLPPVACRRLTDDLADVLAELHALDPDEVGLQEWRRPGDYLQRQLKRWHRQLQAHLPYRRPRRVVTTLLLLAKRRLQLPRRRLLLQDQ